MLPGIWTNSSLLLVFYSLFDRWEATRDKEFVPSLIAYVPWELNDEGIESFIRKMTVADLTRKVNNNDYIKLLSDEYVQRKFGGSYRHSSFFFLLSPLAIDLMLLTSIPLLYRMRDQLEPEYDRDGKRMNTREYQVKRKLFKQRQTLVEWLSAHDQHYVPPADYKPLGEKKLEKLYIPIQDYPDYNFIGLIIGPRGNTQKRLESETGAKICIRGKGSVKEGRNRHSRHNDNEDEPLHVLITGESEEQVMAAVDKIKPLLYPVEEVKNEHKRQQLRELAAINGTLRSDEMCHHCGQAGHRAWSCPLRTMSWSRANVHCEICGELGHPTSDCTMQAVLHTAGGITPELLEKMELEFARLLAELDGRDPLTIVAGGGAKSVTGDAAFQEFMATLQMRAPGASTEESEKGAANTHTNDSTHTNANANANDNANANANANATDIDDADYLKFLEETEA